MAIRSLRLAHSLVAGTHVCYWHCHSMSSILKQLDHNNNKTSQPRKIEAANKTRHANLVVMFMLCHPSPKIRCY